MSPTRDTVLATARHRPAGRRRGAASPCARQELRARSAGDLLHPGRRPVRVLLHEVRRLAGAKRRRRRIEHQHAGRGELGREPARSRGCARGRRRRRRGRGRAARAAAAPPCRAPGTAPGGSRARARKRAKLEDRRPRIGRDGRIARARRRAPPRREHVGIEERRSAERGDARRVEQPAAAPDRRLAVAVARPKRVSSGLHARAHVLPRVRRLARDPPRTGGCSRAWARAERGRGAPNRRPRACRGMAWPIGTRVDHQQERQHQRPARPAARSWFEDPAAQVGVVRRIGRSAAVRGGRGAVCRSRHAIV